MQFSNREKQARGRSVEENVKTILQNTKARNEIKDYDYDVRFAKRGYEANQFKVAFIIYFEDGSKWMLYTSSSYRSDRVKGNQWDAANIKEIINPEAIFFVYDPSISRKELLLFKKANDDIKGNKTFSVINEYITTDQLRDEIANKSYMIKGYKTGKIKDKEGNKFEDLVCNTLRCEKNRQRYQGISRTEIGNNFNLYRLILDKCHIGKNFSRITATTNIPLLPTRGKPKTDVDFKIFIGTHLIDEVTISCKNTNSDFVTVAQFSADSIADALDRSNDVLRCLLNELQDIGAPTYLPADKAKRLTLELAPYADRLAEWALSGRYGIGEGIQIAQYIVTNNDGRYSIYTIDEYIKYLKEKNAYGQFGTLIKWTYPSHGKGRQLTLKMRVL